MLFMHICYLHRGFMLADYRSRHAKGSWAREAGDAANESLNGYNLARLQLPVLLFSKAKSACCQDSNRLPEHCLHSLTSVFTVELPHRSSAEYRRCLTIPWC